MNFYDDERMIIETFQMIGNFETCIPFFSREAMAVFKSVHNIRKWKKWTYNAGKSDPPPDFFSEKYQLMMEVMRIDDHAFVNERGVLINPTNMRESKLQKEIREKIKATQPEVDFNNVRILVNVDSGLSSNEDHNYRFYLANFKRALEKHIEKIPLYRRNHPNKKLVFFVFDESTAYVQVDDVQLVKRGPIAQEHFQGLPVWHFWDKRFLDVFLEADIDFLIWFTPYKRFWGAPIQPPKACIFDIKKKSDKHVINYIEEMIVSAEA